MHAIIDDLCTHKDKLSYGYKGHQLLRAREGEPGYKAGRGAPWDFILYTAHGKFVEG